MKYTKKIFKYFSFAIIPVTTISAIACSSSTSREVLLKADDFDLSGEVTSGTIQLKKTISLPKEVEIRYFVGPSEPDKDDKYTTLVPTSLKNGDFVFVKIFVKENYEASHDIANNKSVKVEVIGLDKHVLEHSIDANDFNIVGANNSGTLSLKPTTPPINDKLEIRYFRGTEKPEMLSSYGLEIPSNLSNGETIWIRVVVKNSEKENYVTNFLPFSITISGLTSSTST